MWSKYLIISEGIGGCHVETFNEHSLGHIVEQFSMKSYHLYMMTNELMCIGLIKIYACSHMSHTE